MVNVIMHGCNGKMGRAVSYTHLDVYKRQQQLGAATLLLQKDGTKEQKES